MLTIEKLTKHYPLPHTGKGALPYKKALDNVSFTLEPGLYGLLGPNGAGKSTLINIITGSLAATKGKVEWNGRSTAAMGKKFRALLGYMPQQQNLYDSFTGERFLAYMAALKEIPARKTPDEVVRVAQLVHLSGELFKNLVAIVGMLAFLACTTACAMPVTEQQNNVPDSKTEAATASAQSVLNNTTKPFTVITPPEMHVYGSGNDTGFYEIFKNDDESRNIMYTDYTTCKQIYLCAQPSCTHDNDACTSWIPPYVGYIIPAATADHLYVIYSVEGKKPWIEQRDTSGSNKKVLCELPSGAQFEPGVLANESHLIFHTMSLDVSGTKPPVYSLIAIDKITGEQQTVYSAQGEASDVTRAGALSLFLMGVTNDGIIVKQISTSEYEVMENNDEKTFENAANSKTSTVILIPFDGTPPKEILSYGAAQVFEEPRDGSLFYIKSEQPDTILLYRLNTQTGEEQAIVPNFLTSEMAGPLAGTAFEDYILRDAAGGYVFFNVLCESELDAKETLQRVYRRFAVNVNDGSMKEITLKSDYGGTTMPVQIVDVMNNNMLLVHNRVEEVLALGNDLPTRQYTLAIISTADYIASVPNYREIDSIRKAD